MQILAMGVPVRVPQKAEFPFPSLHVGGTEIEDSIFRMQTTGWASRRTVCDAIRCQFARTDFLGLQDVGAGRGS